MNTNGAKDIARLDVFIERIDNNKGYTKDNIALICFELQLLIDHLMPIIHIWLFSTEQRQIQNFYKTRFGVETPEF